jgi:glycosyltransferase involved in cell wall biosynthesis
MTSEAPLISVVTAVLNGRERIAQTIESIQTQDFKSVEYVAVDGGSTDGTLEILSGIKELPVALVSESDRGISHAFNKGIAMSRGEYIGILGAGDWYEPNGLSLVAAAAQAHPEADVLCGAINLWGSGSEPLRCFPRPELLDTGTSVYHPSVFIRKSAYERCGGYDESFRYAMDYELLLRMKQKGLRFFALPDTLANMRLGGISSLHWYKGLKEVRVARAKYFPFFNTLACHVRAVIMNVAAKGLNAFGLSFVYRRYRMSIDRTSGMDL